MPLSNTNADRLERVLSVLDPAKGDKALLQDISLALRSIGSHKLVREVISKLSTPG